MKRLLLSMAFLLVSNAAFAATQAEALAKLNQAATASDETDPKYENTLNNKNAAEAAEQDLMSYFQNVQGQMTQEDIDAYNAAMYSAGRWWIRFWDEWDPLGPDNSIAQRLTQSNVWLATGWACYLAQDYNEAFLKASLAINGYATVVSKLGACDELLDAVNLYYNIALNILLKY